MKKWSFIALAAFLCAACSTVPPAEQLAMQEAQLNLSSLKRDEYVVLGRITGEASLVASITAIKNEAKKRALAEPTYFATAVEGDTGNYGFVGEQIDTNLTVTEKAVAMATYNLLNTAKFNNADAVLYVTRQVSIQNGGSKSTVTAKVSGLAIQLKADEGIAIKYPARQKPKETKSSEKEAEKPAPIVPEATLTADEPEQTDAPIDEPATEPESDDSPAEATSEIEAEASAQ